METLELPYRPMGVHVITNVSIQELVAQGFTQLQHISVGGKGMGDLALEALALLPDSLHSVTLWHSAVTRPGLDAFLAATGLSIDDTMATSRGTYMLCL
jgi:hypothetical protein